MLFHPHAGATCTTAEAGVSVTVHFNEVGAGCADQLTRSLEHLVVASQEARIVVGDRAAGLWGGDRLQATLADQLVQQLSVVNNLVVAAHIWVLITQGVEAVCTGHDDLALLRRNALKCLVQHLNVLLREHLEQELVTCTASGVTGTALALAENSELHASGVQQVSHCTGGLGCVVVVDASTANPE